VTRVEQLNAAVDQLRLAHDRWIGDRNIGVAPSDPLCDEIERVQEVYQAGICPTSHILINNAVAALYLKYQEWNQGDSDTPRDAFWESMRKVFDLRQRLVDHAIPPQRIAPIKTLRNTDKATDRQICFYIYGCWSKDGLTYDPEGDRRIGPFINSNGGIDYAKLEAEAEKPGSVVPVDWINPAERHRMEGAGVFDTTPAVQIGPVERSREEREADAVRLVEEGGTLTQVARVCSLTEAEVLDLCDSKEIPRPISGPSTGPTSPEDLDAAISSLIAEGKKDNDIVNILRQRGMSAANMGRVKSVRNRQPVATSK